MSEPRDSNGSTSADIVQISPGTVRRVAARTTDARSLVHGSAARLNQDYTAAVLATDGWQSNRAITEARIQWENKEQSVSLGLSEFTDALGRMSEDARTVDELNGEYLARSGADAPPIEGPR